MVYNGMSDIGGADAILYLDDLYSRFAGGTSVYDSDGGLADDVKVDIVKLRWNPSFDLVLVEFGPSSPVLLAASETTEDTNEGFDFVLAQDATDVVVAYTRPERIRGQTECQRADGQDFEPLGHAVVYWPAQGD